MKKLVRVSTLVKKVAQDQGVDSEALTGTVEELLSVVEELAKEVGITGDEGGEGGQGGQDGQDQGGQGGQDQGGQEDLGVTQQQLAAMYHASKAPAKNFERIASICNKLGIASKHVNPRDKKMVRRLSSVTAKIAGVFAQVDTVDDLDRPLAEIEKAVHSLYGDQSKNGTEFFERRGKGHHGG